MTLPHDPFRPRPTWYRGIRMRSRLEASVAAFLDREDLAWCYEPDAFADERGLAGQYLPDFHIEGLTGNYPLYVEVKGPNLSGEDEAQIFDQMSVIWATRPAVLAIWTAQLFGIEGAFSARWHDGRGLRLSVGRCGPCGGISLRRGCRYCGRDVERISPLLDIGNTAA